MKKQLRPVTETQEARGRVWSLVIRLPDPLGNQAPHLPLFVHISRAISDAITSGRLLAGSRLPGSRTLALALGVHRNTVLRAFDELLAEGWLHSVPGKGTFVSTDLPQPAPLHTRGAERQEKSPTEARTQSHGRSPRLPPCSLPVPQFSAPQQGVLQMFGGLGDLRLLPTEALARAYRRVLRRSTSPLSYADPYGDSHLRDELATMLRMTRGLAVTPQDILITRGSQMALSLAARSVLSPGDVVAVEQWGYPPAWQALLAMGAQLVPIKVDSQGLDVGHLAALYEQQSRLGHPIKALYLTPHHQYPTTVSLSPARRVALLNLATEMRFTIFEDDYDHEFHFDGQPLLPLASAEPDLGVIYMGTLSKVVAPGLRIGYLVAPRPVLARAMTHRFYFDRQGDAVGEAAVAELLEDGELQRHVRKARKQYLARRDACVRLLEHNFADDLGFDVPSGGMALWLRVVAGPSVSTWHEQALKLGVEFQPGAPFALRRVRDTVLRVGYAALTPPELELAVERLKAGWERALFAQAKPV